jgi:hypothetical protein
VTKLALLTLVVLFMTFAGCAARQDMPDDEAAAITHIVQGWK